MFLHYLAVYIELTLCKTALLAVACQSHVCVDHVGGGGGDSLFQQGPLHRLQETFCFVPGAPPVLRLH